MIEHYKTIGVYGVGLLGGSIGLALKKAMPSCAVVGIGRSPERLQKAKDLHAIDRFTCDPADIAGQLDFLVVCTPVRLVAEHVKHAVSAVKPNGIITDVGSTKRYVVDRCETACDGRCHFVGSHPMAGSHLTGVDAATNDLFQNRVCVITPTERTDSGSMETVDRFWQLLGMKTVVLSPEQHDRFTARTSHLPHVVASALCQVVEALGEGAEALVGTGFHDTTRIAAGDPSLWLDIALDNREEIASSIQELILVLELLHMRLLRGDEKEIHSFLERTQQWKVEQERKMNPSQASRET